MTALLILFLLQAPNILKSPKGSGGVPTEWGTVVFPDINRVPEGWCVTGMTSDSAKVSAAPCPGVDIQPVQLQSNPPSLAMSGASRLNLASNLTGSLTFEKATKPLRMGEEFSSGAFTMRPVREDKNSFVIIVGCADELANHAIVEVFYRVSMRMDKDKEPVQLLLHKEAMIPLIGMKEAAVMTDPFYLPWESVEFIRVIALRELGRSEFR